jgi:hypothetical protein
MLETIIGIVGLIGVILIALSVRGFYNAFMVMEDDLIRLNKTISNIDKKTVVRIANNFKIMVTQLRIQRRTRTQR